MVALLPVQFRRSSDSIISYDYEDIENGAGIVVFYGFRASVDATAANDNYILSPNAMVSTGDSAGTAYTAIGNGASVTFSVTFNRQRIVKGNLYVTLPVFTSTGTASLTAQFYHYDGSTATAISSAITGRSLGSGGGDAYNEHVFKIALTEKVFKANEILQLKITMNSAASIKHLYHDPIATRAGFTMSGGALKVYVPFKIQE